MGPLDGGACTAVVPPPVVRRIAHALAEPVGVCPEPVADAPPTTAATASSPSTATSRRNTRIPLLPRIPATAGCAPPASTTRARPRRRLRGRRPGANEPVVVEERLVRARVGF